MGPQTLTKKDKDRTMTIAGKDVKMKRQGTMDGQRN